MTDETLAVIAAVKLLAPEGHRVVTNERDYGWVVGIGSTPRLRSAVLEDRGVQSVTMAEVPELAAWLFNDVAPENIFSERNAAHAANTHAGP